MPYSEEGENEKASRSEAMLYSGGREGGDCEHFEAS